MRLSERLRLNISRTRKGRTLAMMPYEDADAVMVEDEDEES